MQTMSLSMVPGIPTTDTPHLLSSWAPTEGAVAADGHDAVQSQQLAHRRSLGLSLRRAELLAAGGVENGAAAVDDAADAAGIHADKSHR